MGNPDPRDRLERRGDLIRSAVLQVVEKQIAENDPPETRGALERLQARGLSRALALHTIGFAVSREVWAVLRNERAYDGDRVRRILDGLGRGDEASGAGHGAAGPPEGPPRDEA
jgi:hypothetical protein